MSIGPIASPSRSDFRSSAMERLFAPNPPSRELELLVRRVVREEIALMLSGPIASNLSQRPSCKACIGIASEHFGVSQEAITGKSRHREYVRARHAAMWLASSATGLSWPAIAWRFNRNHSTVMHGVAQAMRLYREDAEFASLSDAMFAALQVHA